MQAERGRWLQGARTSNIKETEDRVDCDDAPCHLSVSNIIGTSSCCLPQRAQGDIDDVVSCVIVSTGAGEEGVA